MREGQGIEVVPLPDYVIWIQRAKNFYCGPWDLFEDWQTPPPKWWWIQAADVYHAAESDARAILEKRQQPQSRGG